MVRQVLCRQSLGLVRLTCDNKNRLGKVADGSDLATVPKCNTRRRLLVA